ncbi:hypothetical protein F4808DRAFT_473973 [Astrocystis sublimbata]|nr:hypothetical protein F4808DRAFT_473973 [Astrocystis sublimbata]
MAVNAAADSPETKDGLTPHTHTKQDTNHNGSPELSASQDRISGIVSFGVAQLWKEKTREWGNIKTKGMPLNLLDLPVDVLNLIVSELCYTNDLIALALTHSALYKLAVPNIYSRFDIVWPDSTAPVLNSKSVDALSYGLATLCLPSRFAESTQRLRGPRAGRPKTRHRLANNDHAKYIRKFSIGDGPQDWTSEYLITKESGKMLGTLVAVAVERMVNLETFMWDMPTGVSSDVFMALASHEDDEGQTKLEKVWVRWHDHQATSPGSSPASSPTTTLPPPNPLPPLPPQNFPPLPGAASVTFDPNPVYYGQAGSNGTVPQLKTYAQSCVEYPTFSVLPPLNSLTVLDIDHISYLDEMAVLIERSVSQLRELQVGISTRAYSLQNFAPPWDSADLQQVDHDAKWPGESRIPTARLGGVLGVLVGRIHDIRKKPNSKNHQAPIPGHNPAARDGETTLAPASESDENPQPQARVDGTTPHIPSPGSKRLDGKLRLQTLALERVTLSIAVCTRAIDWSQMTRLTIFGCEHHETLWKALRRQFQPTPPAPGSPQEAPTRYLLSLKHLSTDLASHALLSFVKETLAPNTLETLFLLDRRGSFKPEVTIGQVVKSAVKRHRSSLKKLLIDSSEGPRSTSTRERWRHWAIRGELLGYITSGRMTNLRELGMVIDIKDWHTLLQRLPQLSDLRTLYIPEMVDTDRDPETASRPDAKELALQIVDIISLRREIKLVYVGLWQKCFEISEVEDNSSEGNRSQDDNGNGGQTNDADQMDDELSDNDMATDDGELGPFMDAEDEIAEEASDDGQSEADSFADESATNALPRLRQREILYYDDKVELFRARHGKL